MPVPVRLVIADSHPALREGLTLLLRDDPSIAVVADTGTAADAPGLLTARGASLLLIDVMLPGALRVLRDLQTRPVKIIALGDPDSEPIVEALRLVDDVVLKESELPLLFTTIHAVATDERSIRRTGCASQPVSATAGS